MTVPFMDAYVKLLIKTCHKRGVHAMVSLQRWIVPDSTDESTGWYGRSDPNQGR